MNSGLGNSQAYVNSAVPGGVNGSTMGTHTAVAAPSHSSSSTTTNTTSAAAKAKARALPSVVPSPGVQRTATVPSAIPPTTPTSAVPSSAVASALGPRRTPVRTPGQTPTESPQGTPISTPISTPTKGSMNPKRDRNNIQYPPDQGIGATRSFSTPIDVPLNTSQNVPRESSNNSKLPGLRSAHRNSAPNTLTVDQFEVIRTHSATQSHNPRAQLQLARTLCEAADQLAHRYIDPSHPSSKDVDTAQQAVNRAAWVSQSLSIARQLSHKLEFADAQFFMGTILTTGTYNLEADLSKALEYYLKAARQDHSEACYRVAVCYELGMGTSRDMDRATHFYKRAAQLGSPAAMYKLGMIALSPSSSSASNVATSISTAHPNDSAATLHDFDDDKAGVRNFAKGLEWLELAAARADSRNPHALYELGLLYEHAPTGCYVQGDPIVLDEARSAELHSAAASLGYAPAQSRIGRALEFGELGCQIDPVLSLEYYYAAANQGDADAELAMAGWCWTGGPSLPKSETDALQWAERAAQRGNTRALYCLGYFCECGVGKPVDKMRALACYEAAARRGHARAIEKVATLKSHKK